MKKSSILFLAIVMLTAVPGVSQAALLNLSATSYPLVTADFLTATYDADNVGTNGRLAVGAFTDNWNPDGLGSHSLSPFGTFQVRIVIVPATGAAVSGSLYMTGNADGVGGAELLFQSSALTQFGFGIDDKFEAVFTQQSGSLAPVGAKIGVIIDARHISQFGPPSSPIMPFFTADFGASDGTKADVYVQPIPEPATIALVLAGTGVLVRLRRRVVAQ